jgi:mycofactocin radical SAM maturase
MDRCRRELDFDQCCRFIDELDRVGVFQINFGGGEPFLRDDFLEILRYAHKRRITTCVSTNGTMLTEALVRELCGLECLYLQVSLDGATARTNDAIRGAGSFERIIAGIELLSSFGFPSFSTNTVVTRLNFKEIVDIYKLGRRYGAKTRLSRFRPAGDARVVWEEYRLSRKEMLELSAFLSAHRDVLTGDSFFSITAEDRRDLGLNMCGAAKMTCSVSPEGDVYPCAFLQDDYFLAGNVTQESLKSIWENANAFERLRSIRIESCDSCVRFNQCHGGCPAVAYFFTRSLHQSDPECLKAIG